MYKIAGVEPEEREILFQNTAFRKGMNAAIIEKDFWVCFILDHLFHRSQWKDAFVFKGGTSLSKAFHVIERFSEDIDLIMDWRIIDCSDRLAWQERSRNKQDQFGKELAVHAVCGQAFRAENCSELFAQGDTVPIELVHAGVCI